MLNLTLYLRRDCHLCDAARQALVPLLQQGDVVLSLADIDSPETPALLRAHYDAAVPVLHLNGREIARHRIEPREVRRRLAFARLTLVVLSKFPEAGKVKTRLTVGDRALTPEQAAAVHRVFLLHLLRRLTLLGPNRLVLCYDPPDARLRFESLLDSSDLPAGSVDYRPQSAGNLGDRLASAYDGLIAPGRPVLFLGVDSPDVPDEHLLSAAEILGGSAGSLGPTSDGGYWCIGLGEKLPVGELLMDIPWSSGSEYAATLERFASRGYPLPPSPAWDDVDHPGDLRLLVERLVSSSHPKDRSLLADLQGVLGGSLP